MDKTVEVTAAAANISASRITSKVNRTLQHFSIQKKSIVHTD